MDISLSALLTGQSLLNRGAGCHLINKGFLPQAWKGSIESTKTPPQRTTKLKVVNIDSTVHFFILMSYLCVRAWFRIVESPAVDVLLGALIIARCIRCILPTECKSFPWRSKPMAISSTNKKIISTNADSTVFTVNNHSQDDASSENFKIMSRWPTTHNTCIYASGCIDKLQGC